MCCHICYSKGVSILEIVPIQDLFHVYLNRFEFHFLWLHINKTSIFCFFVNNRRVPGIAK